MHGFLRGVWGNGWFFFSIQILFWLSVNEVWWSSAKLKNCLEYATCPDHFTSPRPAGVVGLTWVKMTRTCGLITDSDLKEDWQTKSDKTTDRQVLGESIKLFSALFWVVNPGELGAGSQQWKLTSITTATNKLLWPAGWAQMTDSLLCGLR